MLNKSFEMQKCKVCGRIKKIQVDRKKDPVCGECLIESIKILKSNGMPFVEASNHVLKVMNSSQIRKLIEINNEKYLDLATENNHKDKEMFESNTMKLRIINSNITLEQYKDVRNRIDLALYKDGFSFEDTITDLLELIGYQYVQRTSYSGDYGVDIIAYDKQDKIAIQCKRYSGRVSLKAVQEVHSGMNYYNCDKAMVITNCTFTKSAIELAEKCNVILVDEEDLRELLNNISNIISKNKCSENSYSKIDGLDSKYGYSDGKYNYELGDAPVDYYCVKGHIVDHQDYLLKKSEKRKKTIKTIIYSFLVILTLSLLTGLMNEDEIKEEKEQEEALKVEVEPTMTHEDYEKKLEGLTKRYAEEKGVGINTDVVLNTLSSNTFIDNSVLFVFDSDVSQEEAEQYKNDLFNIAIEATEHKEVKTRGLSSFPDRVVFAIGSTNFISGETNWYKDEGKDINLWDLEFDYFKDPIYDSTYGCTFWMDAPFYGWDCPDDE